MFSFYSPFSRTTYFSYIVSLILTYICISKGVKISGKIAIYTGSLPFILLVIIIIRGFFLQGSFDGLYYLFKPDFQKL